VSAFPFLRLVLALMLLAVLSSSTSMVAASTHRPTPEDLHPDTGPDPGTCEALRTCGVVK